MPISFKFYKEYGFFLSRWVGDLTDEELLLAYKQLLESEEFSPVLHEICDMRQANLSKVTISAMRQLNLMTYHHLQTINQTMKSAVIAPDDLSFGISRLYQTHCGESPEEVMVFKTLEEALQWIGVHPDCLS